MKKILLFVMLLLGPIMVVDATSISNIDMDIFVDIYGNATVIETWDAYVNQGTEGWHPYYNLGNSEISNLEVSMDGKEYTTISNWDIDKDLEDKAYKAGIYYPSSDEVDICFGVSSYGRHEYVIKYTISNFVSTVEDADIIYCNLFPYDFSAEPNNVDIIIYSDFKYEDTLDVWGYGKYGAPCYVYNGKIEMTSDNSRVTSAEYMTILVKFPKGTFQTNNVLDNDFNYYYEMAEEGSIDFIPKNKSFYKINYIIGYFILFVLFLIFIDTISKKSGLYFGAVGNKVRKDVPLFRDIPCDKDIFYAYWVAKKYNLTNIDCGLLGAVLLKWIYEGVVRVEKINNSVFFNDEAVTSIIFLKRPNLFNVYENKLYDYMYEASFDGKLEQDEFKKWSRNNFDKISKWFKFVMDEKTKELKNKGKIINKNVTTIIFCRRYNYDEVSSLVMEEAEKLAGLKKFLKEFTLINKREPIEVHLWKEYLMYAQIFGIADEVASQFKELYPDIVNEMNELGFDFDSICFTYSISNSAMGIVYRRSGSYSSGGGGFSSGGGGGGSFGGGGGGGGFR